MKSLDHPMTLMDLDHPGPGTPGLVGSLLDEQGDLTAVERFARYHDEAGEARSPASAGRSYSALLPARAPGPGQQLAFEVDLDRCSGCKACVAACHTLNGLDEGEAWRDVGLIVGGTPALPVLQHVTSSCHHCLDPACLNACPVDAYEKDPATGIVRHDGDRCFGCQYCTLACPYDAPRYHAGRGIVRKCDMCGDRLQSGEAPACVRACPHEAIRIRVVDRREVVARAVADDFLPGAPDPDFTLPTTRYVTSRPLPGDVQPADQYRLDPEHAHWSLIIMLVLTQLAVGGFAVDGIARLIGATGGPGNALHLWVCLGFGLLGLAASVAHLGRPMYAYRALIGLKHSWLSREVLAFGVFAPLTMAHVALGTFLQGWYEARPGLQAALNAGVVLAGLAGVVGSVMVYHVVRRPFWHAALTGTKFAGTALVLGLATALLSLAWSSALGLEAGPGPSIRGLGLLLMGAALGKLLFEARVLVHLKDLRLTPLRRSALLLCGPLARPALLRLALGVVGGLVLPVLLILAAPAVPPGWLAGGASLAFVVLLGGELAERYLFFTAVVRPRMPGGVLS